MNCSALHMFSFAKKGLDSVYNLLSPSKRRTMATSQDMNQYAARLATFAAAKPAKGKRASGAKGKKAGGWPHRTPTVAQVRRAR